MLGNTSTWWTTSVKEMAALQWWPVFNIHYTAIYINIGAAATERVKNVFFWNANEDTGVNLIERLSCWILAKRHGAVQNLPASCRLEINLVCHLVWSCVQFHRGRLCRFLITLLPEGTSSSLDKIKDFDWWSMLSSRGCFSSLSVHTNEKGKLWTHNTQIYLRVFFFFYGNRCQH